MNGWINKHEVWRQYQGSHPSHCIALEHRFSWEVHLKKSIPLLEDRGYSGSHEQTAASPFATNPFSLTQKVSNILERNKQPVAWSWESGTGAELRRRSWRMNPTSLENSYLSWVLARVLPAKPKIRSLMASLIY